MNANWKMEADTTGWLDRSGRLYPCKYCQHWNKAVEVCKTRFPAEYDLEEDCGNAAEMLLEKGFVQVDSLSSQYRFFAQGDKIPVTLTRRQSEWLQKNIVLNSRCSKDLVKSTERLLQENEECKESPHYIAMRKKYMKG